MIILRRFARTRARLNRFAFIVAAVAATGPAFAQQTTAAAPTPTPDLQEIIVTGSRIAAPNEVSTSPIEVLDSKYIDVSGKTDLADLITQLPQVFNNSLGQDLGNGTSGLTTAGGVSTADLRGLGPNRTLVLVDGRRLGQGSPYTFIQSPAPDLDQIPAGLVDRIEVVTGGASAAYGSDAIAGVVNFIMKKNYEGIRVDGQYDENWHDNNDTFVQGLVRQFNSTPATGTAKDGRQRYFDVLMGTNFADGKGNITAFLSYRHADPVASSNRDFGSCQLNPVFDSAGNVTGTTCGGSSQSNWFRPTSGPNNGNVYSVLGSGFVPLGSVLTTPPASFNSQPYIFMTREDDRYNAAILAHSAINDYVQPYAEFYFMDDRTHQQIAPAALFKGSNPLDPLTNNYNVNCNNPLLSAQQQSTLCTPAQISAAVAAPDAGCTISGGALSRNCTNVEIGRRNIEGGGRFSDFEHQNYRAVLGSKGDFAEAWSYDLYGQYYYTTFFNSNQKFLNFASIDNALQVTGTPAAPVCVSGPPCVPYNIWSDGGVTQQQLNYLYLSGTGQGTSTLRTLHAEVTGHLGKYGITSPLATDGLGFNIGYEHRNDHEFFQPDSAEQSGLLSGFGSAAVPIDNSLTVGEEFAELRAPLVQDKPFAKEVLFDTGFRHSDYSYAGAPSTITNTYKFEVQYAPIADYRFRASYDKAIRAPSVIELYNPQLVGLIQFGNDPCAPTQSSTGALVPAQFTLAQCQRQGVTAAQYGNGGTTNTIPQGAAGQLSQLTGGNPLLKPEQGETYTIGVNFAPSQIPHFTGSIDYYHIAVTGLISTVPASVIVNNCANTGDPIYCSQVVRNPNTGSLTGATIAGGGYIVQTNVNVGAVLVSGIDVQTAYRLDLPPGFGSLNWQLNGAYLQHSTATPLPGAHTYDCAGLFGKTCQTINPRWHHIFRTTWDTPWNVSASATWRYIGKVSQDNNSGDPTLHYATWGGYDFFNASIPAFNYLDLQATWNVNSVLQVRAGANNVLDKDPPLINSFIAPGGQANTYDSYDLFGRQLFVAFTAKF
ncbi:MAG: iron complex outerrane recepter protein [Gammaproteobacteria bacterium]|jgi:outer membrane receptor protein involved in Fe transport|nr:iron complex outerrane recepter protein [Gammaproteobacteria bacterium]